MGKPHSVDIRSRVIAMVEAGHSCRAAARRFAIGDSIAIRVMQHRRKTGSVSPPRQGRPPGGGKLAAYRSLPDCRSREKARYHDAGIGRQARRDAWRSRSAIVPVAHSGGGRVHI